MAIVPWAVWRPVPSHGGLMSAHLGLVLHVQVGDNSCFGEFDNPANQASSTWWVSKLGVLEQYVDSDYAAWTEAAGNYTWDSVETEGLPTEPLTAAQIATIARLYAWGVAEYGWPVVLSESTTARGFGWHGMGGVAWGNHPDCPGDLRKAQRQAILDLMAPVAPARPVVLPPITTFQHGDTMLTMIPIETDGAGNGAQEPSTIPFAQWNGAATVQGSNPPTDGAYWSGQAHGQDRNGLVMVTVTGCAASSVVNVFVGVVDPPLAGPAGPAGPAGASVTGPRGPVGETGATGPVGPAGSAVDDSALAVQVAAIANKLTAAGQTLAAP